MEAAYYDNIMEQQRLEPEFFRVGFYGRKFPFFLRVSFYSGSVVLAFSLQSFIKPQIYFYQLDVTRKNN